MKGEKTTTIKLDPSFKYEISEIPGGENIRRCYQCGTCSAGCPVGEIDERYNPRKIIRMSLLGMRERVLKSDFIWLCADCFTCQERCPQDVRITELMRAITNLAVKDGYIHPTLFEQVKSIAATGRLHQISDFVNKRRQKMSLPNLSSEIEEIPELFKSTDLTGLLDPEGE